MQDGELIRTKEGDYRRVCARTIDRHIVGVDVGKSADFTAIAVLHYSTRALTTWTTHHPSGPGYTGRLQQDTESFFDLRALERLPLQMAYPQQVARVEQILAHPRLRKAEVLVDATGVGAAVADMFDTMAFSPIRVTITGGHETIRHRDDQYSVPKHDLIGAVLAKLHSKELRLGSGLALLEPLREELNNFQLLGRSATGHEYLGARSGKHDDLVLALGLCCFWATTRARRRGEVSTSFVTYSYC